MVYSFVFSEMDRDFWGRHPKNFDLKGGPSQKLRGEGGHASNTVCTGLREALKIFEGKLGRGGDNAIFFRDHLKTTSPLLHIKNEWSLI